MFVIMGISFYTTRVVLEYLGENDYGIYNVVGGVVSMFSIFSGALTYAISRFLTFEIGKGDKDTINETFSSSLTILIVIGIIFIVLMETLGYWFLNHKMNINPLRLNASNWVFQCSIITFFINLISIPYNALIVAFEHMKAFAYISLFEAIFKLGVAFTLMLPYFDTLKTYAILLTVVSVIIRFYYGRYASTHFTFIKYNISFNKSRFKQLLNFTGWTCIGGSASILNNQGINILLNIFFGTAVNAARGVAYQVNSAVTSFSSNFMMAVNPQIIKTYASDEWDRCKFLVFKSARISFFLILIITVPLVIDPELFMKIWLTAVPVDTIPFVQLILIQSLIDTLCLPLQTLNQASGKIKWYQITAGGLLLINFPTSYVFLKFGFPASCVFFIAIIISILGIIVRLSVLHYLISFPVKEFILEVICKVLPVAFITLILSLLVKYIMLENTSMRWTVAFLSTFITISSIYTLGLYANERQFLVMKLKRLFHLL